jgi:hypothetical protein
MGMLYLASDPSIRTLELMQDGQKTYYGMYFKKDVSHKSDWEYAILRWTQDDSGNWARESVTLEVDGKKGGGPYSDITNTFDGSSDQFEDGNQGRDHPKFYFGKRHHSVHWDMESRNKGSCVAPEVRANDFQFWSSSHLRQIDNIDPNWNYGQASNPHATVAGMCD